MVYVALAEGFEEIEAITIIDVLKRANVAVKSFSIMKEMFVTGAHGICVKADNLFENINFDDAQMLILPGGQPGTNNLKSHNGLNAVISQFAKKEKWLAAICAAPTVFGALNLLNGRNSACYPGCEEEMNGANVVFENVVVDGKIVTSRGPGTAFDFSLKIVEILVGNDTAQKLAQGMLVN